MNGFVIANILTTIVILVSSTIGTVTHIWIGGPWAFFAIWLLLQIFFHAMGRSAPRTDREARPWLYHR